MLKFKVLIFLSLTLISGMSISTENFTTSEKNNVLDIGIYGGKSFFKQNKIKYFDFIIFQLNIEKPEIIEELILDSIKNNYKIIWRLSLPKNTSRKNPPKSTDWSKTITNVFSKYDKKHSLILSLYEETTPWGEWKNVLTETYHKTKLKLPNAEICQWYSNTKNDSAPGRTAWPILPADCIIWDQYHYDKKQYEKYVKAVNEDFPTIKKYSVVWMSPNWDLSKGKRVLSEEYWDKNISGRKRTLDQLQINMAYKIPTAFFLFGLKETGDVTTIWAENKKLRKFWISLKTYIKDLRLNSNIHNLPKYNPSLE